MPHSEPIELPANASNRLENPEVSLDADGRIVLAADSPARPLDFAGITAVSLKSRWPITPEEKAMIPTDGTRDSRKWQTKPRRATK